MDNYGGSALLAVWWQFQERILILQQAVAKLQTHLFTSKPDRVADIAL
jgi:hypothetical protein